MNQKNLLILISIIIVSLAAGVNYALSETVEECISACNEKYKPIDPVKEVLFPDNLTFEETTSAGTGDYYGTAAVLFPTKWEGKIKSVVLNNELAIKGTSYKGRPVFRFKKKGNEYIRPLKFIIETSEGIFVYTMGSLSDNAPVSYKYSTRYTSYGVRNGGRQAWRIPKKGPEFGKAIKVVFSNGHTVYVKNTSKNYRENDGFVFKPGIGPNGEGEDNTGTAHGGVYLHAPYGNPSKQVTFYYGD